MQITLPDHNAGGGGKGINENLKKNTKKHRSHE